jgi:hypothetical protein
MSDLFHNIPPEMLQLANKTWAQMGEVLDHWIDVLVEHRRTAPDCPGAWCPGVNLEGHIQEADRPLLEALLATAIARLADQTRP